MSTVWKIVIAVVVTLAVAGGGTYYYMNQKATSEKDELQSQIDDLNKQVEDLQTAATSAVDISSEATTDEIADWKTYANSTYGFSFKYPAELTVSDQLDQTGNWNVSKKLEISDSIDNLNLWVNPDGFGPFFPEYTYTISASSNGLSITSKKDSSSENSEDNKTLAIGSFVYGSNTYLIHYGIKGSDNKSLSQFDQILSTFEFTK